MRRMKITSISTMVWLTSAVMTIGFVGLHVAVHAATRPPKTSAPVSTSPRAVERFDSDWRFHYGDAPGSEDPAFDDASWRRVDLPHDYSIEDLPRINLKSESVVAVSTGTWKFKIGDDAAWKQPNFNDSAWRNVQVPAHWSDYGIKAENTFAWYRKRISVPAADRGKSVILLVGKVDDVDETFVNGVKVGGLGAFPPNYTTAWEISRRYTVPAGLLKCDGTDVVAVRDYNGQADAGIYEGSSAPRRSGPFDADSEGGTAQGYTLGSVAWYRKTFTLPESQLGRRLMITFDGVYMNSEIWLNGKKIGSHPYGYTGFSFDITAGLNYGSTSNVIAVRVDSSGHTSRWYSGSGIYRHVWLTATEPIHIGHWGTSITTPQILPDEATVNAQISIENNWTLSSNVNVAATVVDPHGFIVATADIAQGVSGVSARIFNLSLTVPKPELWSIDTPVRYQLVTQVLAGGKLVDSGAAYFGIRSIKFTTADGFQLNGKTIKLRGGCVHHDNGALGSAAYDRAEERRIEVLKAAGFNAIRTSHNPPSPAFLEACDRLGMVVIDEAFDCWNNGKNAQDYGRFFKEWWRQDIEAMVLRDRNHPCVVLWSIGNEIPEQGSPEGANTAGMLANYVRELDPSRPVTEATNPNGESLEPLLEHLDVTGYNYAAGRFASDHANHPDRIFVTTESFPMDCFNSWKLSSDSPYTIGDFVWTAMDYLGEAGIGKTSPVSTPQGYTDDRLWTVSNCGDIDILGMQRPQSIYRDVVWGVGAKLSCFVVVPGPDGKPEHVDGWGWYDEMSSWTWPGRDGKPLQVHVYTSYPHTRLLLNGKDLGVKDTGVNARYTGAWDVDYAPGDLVAVGLDDQGKEVARAALTTTGKASAIRLTPDRASISADGEDLSYVQVELVDAKGNLDLNGDSLIRFHLSGPGKIVAVANADPRSEASFQLPERRAWRGRCMVVIKSTENSGTISLTATEGGLSSATTTIVSK